MEDRFNASSGSIPIPHHRKSDRPYIIDKTLNEQKKKRECGLCRHRQTQGRHAAQVEKFEEWAKERQWNRFHHSHYDWWTFPYGCHSGAYGAAYAIYEYEAQLLMLSWGWDLKGRCYVEDPDSDQRWQDWLIRLYKCAKFLK